MKRLNPYQYLLKEVREVCKKIAYRHTKTMWRYPKNQLDEGWALSNLYERVSAAEQLGYEVVLNATDKGLEVIYQKNFLISLVSGGNHDLSVY